MSTSKMRVRVEEIFDKYIVEQNVDKKIKVRFDEIVALQKAMEIERDRAGKAKLQKDSQQAKYEHQVEENMKKDAHCKKITEKLAKRDKVLESIQQEMQILNNLMEQNMSPDQLGVYQESLESIKNSIESVQVKDEPGLRLHKRLQQNTVRVSVPLPQVPQFAKVAPSRSIDHTSLEANTSGGEFASDIRKKIDILAKNTSLHENVSCLFK
ncbi:MAG: hypothetical protein NXI00_23535 [Cytophagales bacterium]|nr:hypothetical protein [Cytophagales bacterium]